MVEAVDEGDADQESGRGKTISEAVFGDGPSRPVANRGSLLGVDLEADFVASGFYGDLPVENHFILLPRLDFDDPG